ncbi:MAG: D-aminoacyl-tRNA deacylase [Christensenellales bacterium]|jgi:D-tyrosyl-tRNA(Tyr) deacylase|nr:D-tyrosyl-tRNA(Tyr) deacylase [Clostridiales bacterium]
MKVVIQRVKNVKLYVEGALVSKIAAGLCVYLGIEEGDTETNAQYLARKVANLRIFEDCQGKMNYSVLDSGGEIMLVSQFTLIGNCQRGNRPDFTKAEKPKEANEMYLYFGKILEEYGLKVSYGLFGAHMKIEQINDGPVTIIIEK